MWPVRFTTTMNSFSPLLNFPSLITYPFFVPPITTLSALLYPEDSCAIIMTVEQVQVPAYHALRQAAIGLQSARSDLVVQLPFKTTAKEALKVVDEALEGTDPTVLVFGPLKPGMGLKL